MAYPTGSFAIKLDSVDRAVSSLKEYASRIDSVLASSDVPSSFVLGIHATMRARARELAEVRTFAQSNPGFVAYVRDQKGDLTLDVGAAFLSVIAAAGDVADTIEAGFPKDASGFLLARIWGPGGPEDRSFSPSQMSAVRAKLAALIASID